MQTPTDSGPAAEPLSAAGEPPKPEIAPEELLAAALEAMDDDKAEDIAVIDLRRKTPLADYMIIANGRSTRHVTTIAEKLMERLKGKLGLVARAEGVEGGDWALVDAGDVIVHVFRPEVRDFYTLERIWLGPDEEPLERRNVTSKFEPGEE